MKLCINIFQTSILISYGLTSLSGRRVTWCENALFSNKLAAVSLLSTTTFQSLPPATSSKAIANWISFGLNN